MLLMNERSRFSKRHKSRCDAVCNACDNHFHVVTSSSAYFQGNGAERARKADLGGISIGAGEKSGESARPIFHLSVIGCCVGTGTVLQLWGEPRELSGEQAVRLIRFFFRSTALPGVHFLLAREQLLFNCAVLFPAATSSATPRRNNSIRED